MNKIALNTIRALLRSKKLAEGLKRKMEVKKGKHPHLRIGRKKGERDYPDLRLKDRKPQLAEEFLKDQGLEEIAGNEKPKEWTYKVHGDGKITAYSGWSDSGGRTGLSQKTFNNPTLKQLRDWAGY